MNSRTLATKAFIPEIVDRALRQDILPHFLAETESLKDKNARSIPVYIGISGGLDSVGLVRALHWLNELSCEPAISRLQLRAVHFDHQQRGTESDQDRLFVRRLCNELQIPLECLFWNETEASADEGASFSQDKARRWRQSHYDSRSSLSRPILVLTAHHRDDSYESQLLKLLRGAHITNLHGMDSLHRIGQVYYGRPLLHATKKEIVKFLEDNEWSWREDSSNQSDKYLRNRVRNELVPLLDNLMGGALNKRLDQLDDQSRRIGSDLRHRAEEYLRETYSDGDFSIPAHVPLELVHEEAIYLWISGRINTSVSYEHLEKIVSQLNDHANTREWSIDVGEGHAVVREGSVLHHTVKGKPKAINTDMELHWTKGSCAGGDLVVSLPRSLLNEATRFVLSTPSTSGNLPFTPPWRRGRSRIKVLEFLRGQKVPLHVRRRSSIICLVRHGAEQRQIVAVHNTEKDNWVIDSEFTIDESLSSCASNATNAVTISIDLDADLPRFSDDAS